MGRMIFNIHMMQIDQVLRDHHRDYKELCDKVDEKDFVELLKNMAASDSKDSPWLVMAADNYKLLASVAMAGLHLMKILSEEEEKDRQRGCDEDHSD